MPPKRKALAEMASNDMAAGTRRGGRNTQSSKISPDASTSNSSAQTLLAPNPPAPKAGGKAQKQKYKYSDPSTLSEKQSYLNLQWPNIGEFLDDENQDMPKNGEIIDPWIDRVSDLGMPVSEAGMEICRKLSKECEKRDQNAKGIHIYNDWNGWGMSEVMANHLKAFNRDIFKKKISPFKKWAYTEGLACFFKGEDLSEWMGNEDGDGVKAIINMLGVMILTTFDMLSEHDLFKPNSEIKNLPIICLMLLDFVENEACDCDIDWGCEVVRACDEAGIKLENHIRKQVSVSKDMLDTLRELYMEKKLSSEHAAEEDEGNGYKTFARMEGWIPDDDIDDGNVGDGNAGGGNVSDGDIDDGDQDKMWCDIDDGNRDRMWYRWDWGLEYENFKKNHPGGTHYDLSKMSRAEMRQYKLF